MTTLAVQDQGSALVVRDRALVVERAGQVLHRARAEDLREVLLFGAVELSSAARRLLARRDVDVLFFSAAGTYESRLVSGGSRNGERRLAQYRALAGAEPTALAAALVAAKIRNQRAVLRRAQRHHREDTLARALVQMRQILRRLQEGEGADLDAIRGYEGSAARAYFEGFGAAISNEEFPFSGRNRRPPRDPVNACLSFGYTLLLRRVESAVRMAGLDPHIGALHSAGRGKPALALDLMEEFRPVLVDRIVLRLINRRQLAPHDFEEPDLAAEDIGAPIAGPPEEPPPQGPPVYLAKSGRALLLREFYTDLRRSVEVDGLERRLTFAALLERQAMQMAHIVEGRATTWTPFILR